MMGQDGGVLVGRVQKQGKLNVKRTPKVFVYAYMCMYEYKRYAYAGLFCLIHRSLLHVHV